MRPQFSVRTVLVPLAAFLCLSGAASAAGSDKGDDNGISAKLGYDHTVGKYGMLRDSTADTTSFTASYDSENYSFDLLIPYLKQTGPGRLQVIAGQRGGVVVVSGPAQVARGIGDVTAGINRYLLNEEDHGIDFDVGANYKFATASETKMLGTGKNDLAIQFAAGRSLGDLNSTLTVGYTFVGKPAGLGYRNSWFTSFDSRYRFTKMISLGATYSASGNVVNGVPGTRDITGYVNFKANKKVRFELYYLKGRTSQSPGKGSGITASFDF